MFGLDQNVLARAVELKRAGQASDRPVEAAVQAQRRARRGIELDVLHALLQDPGSLSETEGFITPEDFRDPLCATVARWVWAGGSGFPEEPAAAALVRELSLPVEGEFRWRETARGGARRMVIRRLEEQKREEQERSLRASDSSAQAEAVRVIVELSRQIEEQKRSMTDRTVG